MSHTYSSPVFGPQVLDDTKVTMFPCISPAGGKKCPACGKRIFHEKWKVTPELAEARWAHKEARNRELDEVTDFFE